MKSKSLRNQKKKEHQNLALLKQKEIEKTYGSMMEYYNKAHISCKVAKEGNIFCNSRGIGIAFVVGQRVGCISGGTRTQR